MPRNSSLLAILVLSSSLSAQCEVVYSPEYSRVDRAPVLDFFVETGRGLAGGERNRLFVGDEFLSAFDGVSWQAGAGEPFVAPASPPFPNTGPPAQLLAYDDGNGPGILALVGDGLFFVRDGQVTTLPSSFGFFIGTTAELLCAAIYDDGTGPALYVGGFFERPASNIARFDGTSWTSVGAGLDRVVSSLVVHDFGSGPVLVAGGRFTQSGTQTVGRVAAWDGTAWTSVGASPPDGPVRALELWNDGMTTRLVAGGRFATADGQVCNSLASFGFGAWTPFGGGVNLAGTGADGGVNVIEARDEGGAQEALLVGGRFLAVDGVSANSAARLESGVWTDYGAGLDPLDGFVDVFAFDEYEFQSGTADVVGGNFTVGADQVEGAARREGSAWVPITERQVPIQKVRDAVVWDDGNESMLYVAGDFGKLPDGSVASYVARRRSDGTWEDVGQGLNGFVLALAAHDGTLRGSPNDASGVYAIGFFDSTAFGGPGGATLNGVARFDGTSWQPVGGGLDMALVGLNFPDWDLRIYEDALGPRLYAAGSFSQIPATGTPTPERLAIWDGASWTRLPLLPQFTFFSPSCFEVWDDGNGEALFIGGQGFIAPFPQGGLGLIVRFDGFTTQIIADPTYMNLGNTPRATDIAVFDDGGGEKLWLSGDSRNSISVFMDGGLATWDGSVWESKTTLFNDGGNELAHSLDLSGSPTLLLAGEGDFNTGRPMGIIDVLSGDFEPTDSAPTALFEAPASQGPGTSVYLGGESLEFVAPLLVDGFAERRVFCSTGETYCFGEGETIPGCTSCPCGNEAPLGSRGGCLNVSGRGTRLLASGEPSVANDTLRFEIRDMTPLTLGVLFSGENRLPANPNNPCFGLNTGIMDTNIADGLRCMGGSTTRRHGGRGSNADGAIGVTTPGWGLGSGPPGGLIDFAGFVAGQTRHFQVFHRDAVAGGCGTGVNTSQGVTIQFQP